MIKGNDDTRFQRARVVRRIPGSQTEKLGFESLSGVAGGRKNMNFKGPSEYRARLLGHQHLEPFLDGDSVSGIFVVWREPSRMG